MVSIIVSAINNLKMMGGGHAVHEQQAILSTTVVISHTVCMERADPQRGVAIITGCYHASRPLTFLNMTDTYIRTYIVRIDPSFKTSC